MVSTPFDDDIEQKLAAFEAPAKRFGSVIADLKVRALKSGFRSFDNVKLFRANRPDLVVIGARPGNGKTSLLVQILRNIAKAGEGHTMMFSLEMSHEQLVLRCLAAEVGCPTDRLQFMPEGKVNAAQAVLDREDIYIDEMGGIDINTLRARAMAFSKRNKLAAIGVDYIQIVRGCEHVGDKRLEVGEIAHGLKQLAKDLKVPVVALAQMSRDIEKRQQQNKNARPTMSDLAECSLVENWADMIMFLDGAGKRDPMRAGEIDSYLVKNRHGVCDDMVLKFDGETTRFSDFEEQQGL